VVRQQLRRIGCDRAFREAMVYSVLRLQKCRC
jgi:hypothetical protein